MRIGQQLGIGFGIVLLLMTGMTVFVTFSLNKIGKAQKTVASHATNAKAINTLKNTIEQWLITTEYVFGKKDLSQLDYHEILEATISRELNEIDWDVYGVTVGNLRDEIVRAFNNIKKLDNTVQMYIRLGNKSPETINMDDAINSFEADASHIARIFASLNEIVNKTYEHVLIYSKKTEQRSWLSIYVIVPIAIGFSIFNGLATTRSITNPLKQLYTATIRIINGSFDVKLNIKSLHEIEALLNHFNIMSLKLNESYKRLETLAIIDKLTGLYNRRYFDEALEKEVLRARRFKHDLSLMFIDIDKFKHFNDTYGHTEGDAVLQRLGRLIKEQARNEIDIACRYGGEEFTVILPETTSNDASAIAERLIKDFRGVKFHIATKEEPVQKTISIGVAGLEYKGDAKTLLVHADKAMYEAKKLGGNRVCDYRV